MAASICVALSWQHVSSDADDAALPPTGAGASAPAEAPAPAARVAEAARPATQPVTEPAAQPATQPVTRPATQPVPRPAKLKRGSRNRVAGTRLSRRVSVSRGSLRKPVRRHRFARHRSAPPRPTQARSPRQRQGFATWGVDVSKWQHPHRAMNWRALAHAAPGFAFTFVKASAGNHRSAREANPWHGRDAAAAKAAGAYVGAYHYATPARPVVRNARHEARKAVRAAGVPRAGDLPLALDLESNTHNLSRRQMARWALTWLQAVERRTGQTPVLYTYPSYFSAHVAAFPAFKRYPLWIAHYGSGLRRPTVPRPWTTWTFWQHSSQGRLPGAETDVDLNVFAGSKRELAALAGVPGSRGA